MTLGRRAAILVATAFGAGYAPVAPGTFGSAAGLILWFPIRDAVWLQVIVIAAVCIAGAWSGTVAERHFGKRDPGQVVVDEVAGMMVTLFLNPVSGVAPIALAFLLFRAADIVKPFPVNRLERLPGGAGIMADDVMAGVYANVALRLLMWVFGHAVGAHV